MTLIPVIDLLQGRAVLARRGQRGHYRPIDSPLCRQGAVLPLVERLATDYGFTVLYLADLDAIQGSGVNAALIDEISTRFPALQLWVDGGFHAPAAVDAALAQARYRPVIGSESWQHPVPISDPRCLLSVDFDSRGVRDPGGITAAPARYPRDVILMQLDRVGDSQGPDLALLRHFVAQVQPGTRLFLAGGVRDAADLHAARAAGADGVLLATALHQGRILAADIVDLS